MGETLKLDGSGKPESVGGVPTKARVSSGIADADGSIDTIKDFNKADEGDVLDAKALLDALGWGVDSTNLADFVSLSGNTINIHDVAQTHSVNIVVESTEFTNFSSIADMINKTNFQT